MYCKFCGKEIEDDSMKCIYCGSLQREPGAGREAVGTFLKILLLAIVAVPVAVILFVLLVLGKMWSAGF